MGRQDTWAWGLEVRDVGHLDGSVVERLPSPQDMILKTQDLVPRWAPCMEPASPSAYVSASLSVFHE